MYDILFICKHCGIHLSAEDSDVGMALPCPDCGKEIAVPTGDILFECPECSKSILASADARGQQFHCFYCEMEISVPSKGKDIAVSDHLPTAKEIEERIKLTQPQEEIRPPRPEKPDATNANQQQESHFMTTWGDYLAKAGLTDEEKPRKE